MPSTLAQTATILAVGRQPLGLPTCLEGVQGRLRPFFARGDNRPVLYWRSMPAPPTPCRWTDDWMLKE